MDDDRRLCLAPQLCIRCRSYGHVVVSNADACVCLDDETCPHNKNTLKKKFVSIFQDEFGGRDGHSAQSGRRRRRRR
ncbi:Hypothetical protein CINCED_3A024418 [Cinara cedri]|uniref:Uncharacterized protein n=1 Tax=Cinara cedri TaxID=506608 RepID=A0A5E4M0L9_9HEMI|nr:Hypothetical protein CINCED_3A024418 [Cinara cedri]